MRLAIQELQRHFQIILHILVTVTLTTGAAAEVKILQLGLKKYLNLLLLYHTQYSLDAEFFCMPVHILYELLGFRSSVTLVWFKGKIRK